MLVSNSVSLSVAQMVKNLPVMQETQVWFLGQEDPLEEDMATYSGILAWRIPMDRGAWWAIIHGVTQSDTIEQLTLPFSLSSNPVAFNSGYTLETTWAFSNNAWSLSQISYSKIFGDGICTWLIFQRDLCGFNV